MILHTCKRCGMEFNQKCNYSRHLERKNQCKQINIITTEEPQKPTQNNSILNKNPHKINPIIIDVHNPAIDTKIDDNISCQYCTKIFTRKDALKRHLDNYCKLKKEKEAADNIMMKKIVELEEKNKRIEEKNKIMEQKINILESKKPKKTVQPQQNIIINNGVINNNNNQINIANFGTIDSKKIGNNIFYNTLTNFSGLKTFIKFIEYVHKNDKLKEYQNVEITDLGRNLGRICTNNSWVIDDANNISDKIIDESYNYYELKFIELEDDINAKTQKDKAKIKKNKRFIFTMKGSEMFEMNDDGDFVDDDGVKVTPNDFKNGRKFEEKLKRQVKMLLKK